MVGVWVLLHADLELQRHWGSVQGLVMVLDIDSLAWTRIEANPFSTYTHSTPPA